MVTRLAIVILLVAIAILLVITPIQSLVDGYRARYNLARLISGHTPTPTRHGWVPSPCRVVLVSGSIGSNRPWTHITHRRLLAYGHRFGYSYRYFTTTICSEAPAIWQKIYALREELNQDVDAVVWIDDDVLITSPRSIESYLAMTDRSIIVSADLPSSGRLFPGGSSWNVFNTGVIILRCNSVTRNLLDAVIAGRTRLDDGYFNHHLYHEQSVLTHHVYTSCPDEIFILPHRHLQTLAITQEWQPGDFSYHAAGMTSSNRTYHLDRMDRLSRLDFIPESTPQESLEDPGVVQVVEAFDHRPLAE